MPNFIVHYDRSFAVQADNADDALEQVLEGTGEVRVISSDLDVEEADA